MITLARAIGAGLRRSLADDDRVVLLGEDIGALGGVFRITDGLQAEFGGSSTRRWRKPASSAPPSDSRIAATAR